MLIVIIIIIIIIIIINPYLRNSQFCYSLLFFVPSFHLDKAFP